MTCIVGYANNGKIFMGADSCGSSEDSYQIFNRHKIFIKGKMLIGVAGSYRLMDIMEHHLETTTFSDKEFIKNFTTHIRNLTSDYGCLFDSEGAEDIGGEMLIGYKNNLYYINPDLSILPAPDQGLAIGSGAIPANAILHHYQEIEEDCCPMFRMESALSTSEALIQSVKGPFIYKELV